MKRAVTAFTFGALGAWLAACTPGAVSDPVGEALAEELAPAADAIMARGFQGVAVGEVHGQRDGVALMQALVERAREAGQPVVVLIEAAPVEVGLPPDTDWRRFQAVDMTAPDLPLWTTNTDKRATVELREALLELRGDPGVEVSYLMGQPPSKYPNGIKAHGLAEQWHTARQARPEHFIVGLMGNYHSRVATDYPLEVTNSLCRYLEEAHGYTPLCLRVSKHQPNNVPCPPGVQARVVAGADIGEPWPLVVERLDGCTRAARWVEAPLATR